jgi:hypothetical protein
MTQPKTISALPWQPEINPKWLGKMNESQDMIKSMDIFIPVIALILFAAKFAYLK